MPVLPFSEYRPDVSDYEGTSSKDITNVVPRGDGYGPFPSLASFTATLPGPCRGYFFAHNTDGSITVFAGTSTNLYQLNNTTLSWTNVSKSGGPYSALSASANWQFAQFNTYVFATQASVALQIFTLGSSSAFADRSDSNCMNASYVTTVNRFLVLSGGTGANAYRIQWSGLNDVSSSSAFTSGINSSDYQDFAEGGIVRGVSGGDYGVIFQDAAIRMMNYAPGSTYIFYIDRISIDDGMFAPYSLIRSGNNIFWCSPQGFKMIPPGGSPTPIGKERVDRTFFADVDTGNLQLFIGANDPTQTRVYWVYKSVNGLSGQTDKMLIYDWALDKWSSASIMAQFTGSLAKPGLTLEAVDAAYGTGTPFSVTSMTTGGLFSKSAHGLAIGQGVQVTSTATAPSGFVAATPYYVMSTNYTSSQFQLSASGGVGPLQGSVVTSSSTGSGTLSVAAESIETLNLTSLDAISIASLVQLSAFTPAGALGFFGGSNLQATLETPEHGGDGKRVFVRGFRVVSDAPSIYGSVSSRESPQASYNYSSENTIDARGYVPQRVSTRYAREKVRIPSGTKWTFAAGVEPDVRPDGMR